MNRNDNQSSNKPDGSRKPADSRRMSEYEAYRAHYEQLLDDLKRRDRSVQNDPFQLQRWPQQRKLFADRLENALTDWEIYGHKSEIEAEHIRFPPAETPASHKLDAYKKYRSRYEHLRDDLETRDQQAQADPFKLQRWPRERRPFADGVQRALDEWEVFGYKSEIESPTSHRNRNFKGPE